MKHSLPWLFHNVLVHPICGVLWFLGAETWGDRLHATHPEAPEDCRPKSERETKW